MINTKFLAVAWYHNGRLDTQAETLQTLFSSIVRVKVYYVYCVAWIQSVLDQRVVTSADVLSALDSEPSG